ncbi:MAG: alpha/beta fold hydrolase [Stellaceae bacterium]
MPELVVNGCTISYQEFGSGPVAVVLTPGGRWGGYVHRVVATALAEEFRVITWDRRNTDARADIIIAGDSSEADHWADDLAALIKALKLGPCYVGEYAGCRVTPLLCVKYPQLVKGLMLAWCSGGEYPAGRLPKNFYQAYTRAALRRGMEGVIDTNHFAASIKQNPGNRERLLRMDPREFIRQMAYWEAFFITSGDLPIAGCRLTDDEWASIRVPASVTGGVDPTHPTEAAQRLARLLPQARYHEPVVTVAEWDANFGGPTPYPITANFQGEGIAPVWRDFLRAMERSAGTRG